MEDLSESDVYLRRPVSLISSLDSVLEYFDELLLQNRVTSRRFSDSSSTFSEEEELEAEDEDCQQSGYQRVMDLSFASVYELEDRPVVFDVFNVTDIKDSEATDSGLDATSMSDCEQPICEEVIDPNQGQGHCQGRPRSSSREKCANKKRKEKIYEICLGHECVNLQQKDLSITIYSLQKSNKDSSTSDEDREEKSNAAIPEYCNLKDSVSDVSFAGRILFSLMSSSPTAGSLISNRKQQSQVHRQTLVGSEMIDWILQISPEIRNRIQARAVWQVLLQESVILPVDHNDLQFRDKYLFYRFSDNLRAVPCDASEARLRRNDAIAYLIHRAPDAVLKSVLEKPVSQRTSDDIELIYEELLTLEALKHLSTTVRKELAHVIAFESAAGVATLLFSNGVEGVSWFVVLKGSVNVVIKGKNETLVQQHPGNEDAAQISTSKNALRAANMVTRDEGCHFLRVDKDDFNRLLRDVEANTIRLKEHGKDVLVLEKITPVSDTQSQYKYSVMAGTPQKMMEHLLETRLDGHHPSSQDDTFLDDFLLTHVVFLPTHQLVADLIKQYRMESPVQDRDLILQNKSRIIRFVYEWITTIGEPVLQDPSFNSFLKELETEVEADFRLNSRRCEEVKLFREIQKIVCDYRSSRWNEGSRSRKTWNLPPSGQAITLFHKKSPRDAARRQVPAIQADDDIIFRVYCADHTFCTLRMPLSSSAGSIKLQAADKLGLGRDSLVLAEIKSNGERVIFKDSDRSIPTCISINGRIFVSPKDTVETMVVLPDQAGPIHGSAYDLEKLSTRELAYEMTLTDWDLFCAIHEYELIDHVTSSDQSRRSKSNLNVFLRRFNELQFWVVTEICLATNIHKRAQLLKKFIKLAACFKEQQNLNAFFALVMGLNNVAVSRLTQTWDKVPSKLRKIFVEFDGLIEPSRNHRAYRIAVSKLKPPIIPFMPLLLKDMTFTHEGNRTLLDNSGLVNFEKMHIMAQSLRTLRFCSSSAINLPEPVPRPGTEVDGYLRNLRVIDDQRILNSLSHRLEPKRS